MHIHKVRFHMVAVSCRLCMLKYMWRKALTGLRCSWYDIKSIVKKPLCAWETDTHVHTHLDTFLAEHYRFPAYLCKQACKSHLWQLCSPVFGGRGGGDPGITSSVGQKLGVLTLASLPPSPNRPTHHAINHLPMQERAAAVYAKTFPTSPSSFLTLTHTSHLKIAIRQDYVDINHCRIEAAVG